MPTLLLHFLPSACLPTSISSPVKVYPPTSDQKRASAKPSALSETGLQEGIQMQPPSLQLMASPIVQRHAAPIQRQDVSMTVSNNISEARNPGLGSYAWVSSYALEITDDACQITIDVEVHRDADVSEAEERRVKRQTANEFARYWDSRFNLVDDTGNRRPIRVALNYVNTSGHLSVALHAGDDRDDLSNWYVLSDNTTRAHELGHQLGMKDEYIDATVPNRANAAAPGIQTDHSIMGNYYTEGQRGADVRARHGDQLAGDISAATGMNFTAELRDSYIVRRGDTLSWIAERIYGDASKWQDIYALNTDQIQDPNLIYPGQELQLPPHP